MDGASWGKAFGAVGKAFPVAGTALTNAQLNTIEGNTELILQREDAMDVLLQSIANTVGPMAANILELLTDVGSLPSSSAIATSVWNEDIGGSWTGTNFRYAFALAFQHDWSKQRLALWRHEYAVDFLFCGSDVLPDATYAAANLNFYSAQARLEGETDAEWLSRVTGVVWLDDNTFGGHAWYYDTYLTGDLYGSGFTYIYSPIRDAGLTLDNFMYEPSSGPPKRNSLTDALVLLMATSAILGWTDG